MKSYEENKLLGGASCENHIFLNAFALVISIKKNLPKQIVKITLSPVILYLYRLKRYFI